MNLPDLLARVRRLGRLPLLVLAAAVLALGWLVTPTPVPLYDGVGMPDEPYRYVVPPSGTRATPPVTAAEATIALDTGRSCCELEARSAEQGPQVAVYVPRGGLAAAGSGELTLAARPLAPPAGPAPEAQGRFEGNVYRVQATGPQGSATLTAEAARATIQLRALNGNTPGPGVWYRPDAAAGWRLLPTGKTGFDIYEAQLAGVGDYVLVRGPGGSGSSSLALVAGILAVPAILVVILVVLRIRAGGAAGRGMDEEDLGADDPDVGDADDEVRRSGAPRR